MSAGLWLSPDSDILYWEFDDGVIVPMEAMDDDDWREAIEAYA